MQNYVANEVKDWFSQFLDCPLELVTKYEMRIDSKIIWPFLYRPRRIMFHDKSTVSEIIDGLIADML